MNKLRIIHELAQQAGYNEEGKLQFKTLAMKALRRIAKELNLIKDTYEIRFNKGGIAVSGDATLHHEQFYLTIGEMGVMWRTCKGLKDYSGGGNRWAIGFGQHQTEQELIASIKYEVNTLQTNPV